MEDLKKRKMDEAIINGSAETSTTQDYLRSLLDPLNKPQLVDLLSRLCLCGDISLVSAIGRFVSDSSSVCCVIDTVHEFRMHGEIEEGSVIYDKATGKSRGYGFITYKHMESAQSALGAPSKLIDVRISSFLNDTISVPYVEFISPFWEIARILTFAAKAYSQLSKTIFIFVFYFQGRMAVCNLACEGLTGATTTPDLTQRKLYIGGLSPEISSEMLLHFFGRYGAIEEGSVAYNKDTNESRGFGFVTYKTVEAAKKAIDDPHKLFGDKFPVAVRAATGVPPINIHLGRPFGGLKVFKGRTITVKLADTHKGKTVQMQSPTPMVPVPVPMAAAGYVQPGKAPVGSGTPVGYPYPQTVASYPASSYPNPPVAPAPYPTQSQVSYAPVSAKKELLGLSSTPPVGMGGYPYYYPKQ
ncbi:hypothetical protein POTOM_025900 [Populus tomentosa]|uniref:RRM domain-containing protein n=1 Tax=Populus tomentosa TaxID=118781 RepID=A0A8X8CXM2_POPTO|nr:hypothetical protein POTOM_025900 [Populus tomentosa]